MGQILSKPKVDKSPEKGGDSFVSYGLTCMQGWRISMEDSHATILSLEKFGQNFQKEDDEDNKNKNKNNNNNNNIGKDEGDIKNQVSFFGVYDGHGGEKVALFTGENLHKIIQNTDAFKQCDYPKALKDGFLNCDVAILEDENMKHDESGCAATTCIITKEKIYCANAGDSRTIMSVDGSAKALSYDHKPSNEGEKARICAAGGFVDIGRVNGNLALSRGIGDFEFKKSVNLPPEEQIVTADPDIIEHISNPLTDEFIVLACDGIWDCLSSQQVIDVVRRGITDRKPLEEIGNIIMDICLAPSSAGSGIGCDNMSVCIVALLHGKTLQEWYDYVINKIENEKIGKISIDYDDLSKELYGLTIEEKLANAFSNSNGNDLGDSLLQNSLHTEENNSPSSGITPALSLEQLLQSANGGIKAENGVIYLDTASASGLLASLGVHHGYSDDDDDDVEGGDSHHEDVLEDDSKIEEVSD
ncbi:hypothetical protein PACTADRAFT_42469 [Pachysolen tannophilus NRRL Y-2460]|uniref:protein-serine/threonine phosphatase n=1 Tax=Pachysolen tannophilus NRRL Y-2460 TaxID=669874 RepID=A0A1E4TUL6_PACTA|nr:hypothetical protein PACTADRAFT_42469 [Pachysolen tannophilus NRRL Y-2460]